MPAGDLAPTFSNIYPEILAPWISEQQFRTLVRDVNEGLVAAFDPLTRRSLLDSVVGVATGWLWESVFAQAAVKKRIKQVERRIEEWNSQLEKEAHMGGRIASDEDRLDVACCIPLRRTGFLSLDIQIPDPMVGVVNAEGNGLAEDPTGQGTSGEKR